MKHPTVRRPCSTKILIANRRRSPSGHPHLPAPWDPHRRRLLGGRHASRHVLQRRRTAVPSGPPARTSPTLCKEKIIDAAPSRPAAPPSPRLRLVSENGEFAEMVGKAGLRLHRAAACGHRRPGRQGGLQGAGREGRGAGRARTIAPVADLERSPAAARKPATRSCSSRRRRRRKGMRIVSSEGELSARDAARTPRRRARPSGRPGVRGEVHPGRPAHRDSGHGRPARQRDPPGSTASARFSARYQKVVEESPSVAVEPNLRRRIGQCAYRLAAGAGYVNAGTVESSSTRRAASISWRSTRACSSSTR